MEDNHVPPAHEPVSADYHVRGSYLPVKEGHPRFNAVVLLLIVATLVILTLVAAHRLYI